MRVGKFLTLGYLLCGWKTHDALAYSVTNRRTEPKTSQPSLHLQTTVFPDADSQITSRRSCLFQAAFASTILLLSSVTQATAFDGSGSSAYSGRSPQSVDQRRKSYKVRVAADVRDFNALGKALPEGPNSEAWKFFFIPFPRNAPDSVGRTYAALADFVGHKSDSGNLEGSAGYLLAASFAKAGKPPDNAPAVQAYKKLAPVFANIQKAGEKGDATKAQEAWTAASVLFSKYLSEVDMPDSLSDPLYN